jgi:hypothetical protein
LLALSNATGLSIFIKKNITFAWGEEGKFGGKMQQICLLLSLT